jgi:hypothetical protein
MTAGAPRAEPLRITHTTWVGYGPLFVAQEKGFFAAEGEVELINIDYGGAATDALVGFRRKLPRAKVLSFFAAQPPCRVATPPPWHSQAVGGRPPHRLRFNRRTARCISHRFARLIEHAVQTPPTTCRALAATPA